MNSFSDVIDALGIAGAAAILGIPESHVRTLKARDSIPASYFKRIVDSDAGKQKGVTFDVLYRLVEKLPPRKGHGSSSEARNASSEIVKRSRADVPAPRVCPFPEGFTEGPTR